MKKYPYGRYGMFDGYHEFNKKETMKVLKDYNASDHAIELYFQWVEDGNSFYENPAMIYGEDGSPLNFIEGYRSLLYLMEEYENEQSI